VLESPHKDEVKNGYPVAGKSGKDISKVLFDEVEFKNLSFGELIYSGKITNFGIVNISNIPLQSSAYGDEIDFDFREFNLFRQNPHLRKKECLLNDTIRIFRDDFKMRLQKHTDKKLILCGAFAQAVFYDCFSKDDFVATIDVPHPSFNNWSKQKYKSKVKQLMEFIS
jgi:hypothetical protein